MSRLPAPPGWALADTIANARVAFDECRTELERLTAEWEGLFNPHSGAVIPSTKAYRSFLPGYRADVGALVALLPSGEDRWTVIGDTIAAPGPLDTACRALLDEGRITPGLIRKYGLTRDDLMALGGYDYDQALRRGVMLDTVPWERPVEAFMDSPYVRDLDGAISALMDEMVELSQWWPVAFRRIERIAA